MSSLFVCAKCGHIKLGAWSPDNGTYLCLNCDDKNMKKSAENSEAVRKRIFETEWLVWLKKTYGNFAPPSCDCCGLVDIETLRDYFLYQLEKAEKKAERKALKVKKVEKEEITTGGIHGLLEVYGGTPVVYKSGPKWEDGSMPKAGRTVATRSSYKPGKSLLRAPIRSGTRRMR